MKIYSEKIGREKKDLVAVLTDTEWQDYFTPTPAIDDWEDMEYRARVAVLSLTNGDYMLDQFRTVLHELYCPSDLCYGSSLFLIAEYNS